MKVKEDVVSGTGWQDGSAPDTKKISLALQGGGSHGAFTWGVLDRLLEDERISIDAICGTSAGAMNGAMVACGMAGGGRRGARELLETFWRRISEKSLIGSPRPSVIDRMIGPGNMDFSLHYHMVDLLSRLCSPYEFTMGGVHPLQEILDEITDFDLLKRDESPKLFVCATNVNSGKIKVFNTVEVCTEALLASACLPFAFQAVEIDGQHYWDGGYMGNPPIFPLIYECEVSDIVIIQIDRIASPKLPKTGKEILDRVSEISFNSCLMRELRVIAYVTDLLERENFKNSGNLRRLRMHLIGDAEGMEDFGVSSKLNAEWDFLTHLRDIGRRRAAAWLDENFENIGVESTLDIFEMAM